MKKTKILAPLLALVLILSSFSALTVSVSATDNDSDNRVDFTTAPSLSGNSISYVTPSEGIDEDGINTYEEFAFALQNYGTDKFPAQEIELTGDLDLSGLKMESTIFGNLVDGMVIDGNGYAIKNFNIDYWQDRGLFEVGEGTHFVIKNLDFGTAEKPIPGRLGGGDWKNHGIILGTAGYNTDAKFSFDIDNVDMYVSFNRNNGGNKGGLAAFIGKANLSADSSIKNSNVYGSITHYSKTGWNFTSAFVANLLGNSDATLTIENCANYATLTGGNCSGAFVGSHEQGANLVIDNCVNLGAISSEGDMVGGLVGRTQIGTTTITDSVNLGTVKGASNVAGLVGSANTAGTLTVTNSINAADITAGGTAAVSQYANKDANKTVSVTDSFALQTATLTGTETVFEGNSTLGSLDEVAAKMRDMRLGYYTVQDGKVALDTRVPQIVGAQTSTSVGETFDVRFVAVLKNSDLSQYSKVGFKVEATCDNGQTLDETKDSSVVFKSLNASVDGAMKTHKSYELGGDYIIAIAWNGVPANNGDSTSYTVNFKVTPYAVDLDEETTYTGLSYSFTYVNGKKPAAN